MARVAIIGSCITRDLWPIRGDGVEGLLYVSRTSLPSLFSQPVQGFTPLEAAPPGLTRYQHDAVVADLAKLALAQLVAHRPTHLILDFIDERFDLLATPQALATHSWELAASGYDAQPALAGARPIPRTSAACERLWNDAAAEFCAFVAATPLRNATLILHESHWADRYRDAEGRERPFERTETWDGRPTDIGEQNALLARYQDTLLSLAPGAVRVSASPANRVGDEAHRWGLSPFHYVDGYYAEIWDQLHALGI